MTNELRCYGIFGCVKVAYFDADDKVGVPMSNWTNDHVAAMLRYAYKADQDESTTEWVVELVKEYYQTVGK